jgi:hypothetical protein
LPVRQLTRGQDRIEFRGIGTGLSQRVFTLPWLTSPPIGFEALSALVQPA